jgi:hypothetical protein
MKPLSNTTELTPESIAAILASLQQPVAPNPVMEILERRLKEEEAEKAEQKRVAQEARKQNALAMENKRRDDDLQQEYCSHIKPNRETHVVGQRDHSNNYHYFCQACKKHWIGKDLPPHLAPDPERVGGPQF